MNDLSFIQIKLKQIYESNTDKTKPNSRECLNLFFEDKYKQNQKLNNISTHNQNTGYAYIFPQCISNFLKLWIFLQIPKGKLDN